MGGAGLGGTTEEVVRLTIGGGTGGAESMLCKYFC